jgi:hypothetical protein
MLIQLLSEFLDIISRSVFLHNCWAKLSRLLSEGEDGAQSPKRCFKIKEKQDDG